MATFRGIVHDNHLNMLVGDRVIGGTTMFVLEVYRQTIQSVDIHTKAKRVELFPAMAWSLNLRQWRRRRRTGSWWRNSKSENDMTIAVGKKNDLSLQQHLSGRKGRQCGCMEAVRVIRGSFQTNATPDTISPLLHGTHPLHVQRTGSNKTLRNNKKAMIFQGRESGWGVGHKPLGCISPSLNNT